MERNTRKTPAAPEWLQRMIQLGKASRHYKDYSTADLEEMELYLSDVLQDIRSRLAAPLQRKLQLN